MSSRPTAEKVGNEGREPEKRNKPPLGAAAASAVAQEQSLWSSALPGLVSVTTISVLESTYRSEPTWRLWSGPSSASYHLYYAMPPTSPPSTPPPPAVSQPHVCSLDFVFKLGLNEACTSLDVSIIDVRYCAPPRSIRIPTPRPHSLTRLDSSDLGPQDRVDHSPALTC